MLATLQCLYIDTDPEALEAAEKPDPARRLAGLRRRRVFPAKLNRAAHYLKPRFNGRTLTEGWFDPRCSTAFRATRRRWGCGCSAGWRSATTTAR